MSTHQVRITLSVRPGAHRNEVVAFADGVWRVRVAAPPVEGKANKELITFLSDVLGIAKSSITIVSGLTSRRKVLAIAGLTADEVAKRLSS